MLSDDVIISINNICAIKKNEEEILISGSDYTFKSYSGVNTILSKNNLIIYPNPADNFIYLQQDDLSAIEHFQIYVIAGHFIKEFSLSEILSGKLFTGDLSTGTYQVKILSDPGISVQTLLIAR